MKIRQQLIAVLALPALLFTQSCGSGQNAYNAKVKPETTAVSGDLSDAIAIVDGEYQVTDNYGGKVAIKVKALKPVDLTGKSAELRISFLDDKSSPLAGLAMTQLDLNSVNTFQSLLKRGSGEEILTFNLVGWTKDMAKEAKKFTVTSQLTTATVSSADEKSTPDATTVATADGNSSDFDQMLDDYEKSVDGYIKMVKGMDSDNPGAVADGYADAMNGTLAMETKLKAAKTRMTAKQASRMVKIEGKMVKAMEESEKGKK